MKKLVLALALLLLPISAFAQGSRQIQSSDVTGALGYTPLQSIGGQPGPAIACGSGMLCSGNTLFATGVPVGTSGQIQYNNAGAFGGFTASGDATINTSTGAVTLATVNANVGSFGSAVNCVSFTTNAKGLITAASAVACTPAIASITGMGTGVATALVVNVGTAGSIVVNGGALGTPSSGTLTNTTGFPVANLSGAVGNCLSWLATSSSANLRNCLSDETGTGAAYFQGGDIGTPSAGVLTNATGYPVANISGAVANCLSWLATSSSANLRNCLTDESGTGAAYFQGGDIGTPSAGVATNLTQLNATQLTSGTVPTGRLPLASPFAGTPANPTGTTSATPVMMGLGSTCTFTPTYSGKVEFTIWGAYSNTTTTTSTAIRLQRGTGAAPANGAAQTGTSMVPASVALYTMPTANAVLPFSMSYVATGLTLSTAVWFDLAVNVSAATTTTVSGIVCTAKELP